MTRPIDHVTELVCLVCGKSYAPDEIEYVCPDHGTEGIVDVRYDYELIGQKLSRELLSHDPDPSMWRYKALLPVAFDATVPPLAVGWTPCYETAALAAHLGLRHAWVKDEGRQPTGSLKDRASAVALVKAEERRAEVITTASTGNAAAALSGLCASVGKRNVIFVPEKAPEAKVAQLLAYGSTVLLVRGSYDEAFDLCLGAAAHYGWYNRNTGFNPYMSEGKKTAAYEIAEQLGWEIPDVVVVSVGDGCIIGGLHKGFKDLAALGWVDGVPRLIGVQAEGSNYLTEAWEQDQDVFTKPAIRAHTIADSISAGLPRDRLKAMAAVQETAGAFVAVTDDEILAAIPELAAATGVFAEPAGAAAYAGLIAAIQEDLIDRDDRVLVLNTGSGLKDVASARRAVDRAGVEPLTVDPELEAVRAALGE